MQKSLVSMAVAGLFIAAPLVAVAADAAPAAAPPPVTGSVTIGTDYIFRGMTQTNSKPMISGELDYTHSSGFYASTALTNVSWFGEINAGNRLNPLSLANPNPNGAGNGGNAGGFYNVNGQNSNSVEWDVWLGFKGAFATDFSYDVGLYRYMYPGTYNNLGPFARPDTSEWYVGVGYKWVTLKYNRVIGSSFFGMKESGGTNYLDLTATIPLGESGFNLIAHTGRQSSPSNANLPYFGVTTFGNNNLFAYSDWKIGVTKDWAGFSWALNATGTNARALSNDPNSNAALTVWENVYQKNMGKSAVVGTISKAF